MLSRRSKGRNGSREREGPENDETDIHETEGGYGWGSREVT